MDVSIIYGLIAYGLMSYCSYICMASFRIWFYSVYGFVVYGAMLYTADTVGYSNLLYAADHNYQLLQISKAGLAASCMPHHA